jgi:hypothetical protein
MPEGVDTAMNAMKLLGTDAPGQALTPDPVFLELGDRHDSVLIRRDPSDLSGIGVFLTHVRE